MKLMLAAILLSLTLSTTTPNVSIYSPANGSIVSGKVDVIFTAYDSDGLSKFEFYVDGELIQTLLPVSPRLSFSWNTNRERAGEHQLTVVAYDKLGNAGSASSIVTVEK